MSNLANVSYHSFPRIWKHEVMHTNHRNVTKSLLDRECRRQSVRFVLNDAFLTSDAEFSRVIKNVNEKCPTLLQYLKAAGTSLGRQEENRNVDSQRLREDRNHHCPEAQIRLYPKSDELLQDDFLSVIYRHKLPYTHPFVSELREAYGRDYDLSNIFMFGHHGIQWARRLKFTDP